MFEKDVLVSFFMQNMPTYAKKSTLMQMALKSWKVVCTIWV